MYPTIYHAVKDLFGIEISFLKLLQSFGFFVALAFLIAAWVIVKEMRRYSVAGIFKATVRKVIRGGPATTMELAGSFALGFFVGWKVIGAFLSDGFSEDPRAFMLSGEGALIPGLLLGAASAAYTWYSKNKNKKDKPEEIEEKMLPEQHVGNIILWGAAFGFLGAKIFHILENFGSFLEDPSGMFFSFSGLTMYGGLIMGGAAVIWYAWKNKFGIWHLADVCSPAVMLAYGIGRMGCHVSGDGDWGVENSSFRPGFMPSWFWSYKYPHNVNSEGVMIPGCTGDHCRELPFGVFPTPLYESIAGILLFFFLWSIRKRLKTPGMLFSIFLIVNGTERFFIELIRVNNVLFSIGSFGVTQAELIAFFLVLTGCAGVWWTKKHNKPALS